jgi:nuclear pore complex protein Nup93
MANDQEMSGWTDLLHSSSKLLEQAAPSSQFPPLQRNLDQLEALSKKLKAKTLRNEAPSQSIAATRLLAREGINAEQLARDLKSFELKVTFFILAVSPYNVLQGLLCLLVCFSLR